MPTASGAWLTLRGSILEGGPEPRVAILIEPARDADLLPMALDAYGLTDREREVTALIVRGLSAPAVGRTLFLSPWTVKDHLKAIFDKVGVSSRAELVAAIHHRWALNLGDDSDGLDARQVSRRSGSPRPVRSQRTRRRWSGRTPPAPAS